MGAAPQDLPSMMYEPHRAEEGVLSQLIKDAGPLRGT